LDWYDSKPIGNRPVPDDFRTYQIERALEGFEQDANGHYYNGDNERVYVFRDPAELGDDSNGYVGEDIVMRTEQEIRDIWNADQGMGYFQKANPQLSVDDYINFVGALDEMYASGQLELNKHDDLYYAGHKGRGPNADAINSILQTEKERVAQHESEVFSTLMGAYGIQDSFVNDDGDVFKFNGSNYTKTHKVDDHLGVGDYVKMGAGVLMSVYAGPMIAGSLGSFMGPAMAKAASSAIISQATALMNGQGLSIGDALQSAALSYGGSKLGDMFASGGELSGTVSEITDKVTSTTDKLNEFLSTGNSIADAAIKAGGMSMLTSLVMTGEVDLESAGLAALMAGGAEGLGKLNSGLLNQGAEGIELEEVVVTAQKKGVEVADGLTKLENGLVINSAGEIMGTMDDLDLDGDGMLNANDLQNITTNNEYVPTSIGPNNSDGTGNTQNFQFNDKGELIASGENFKTTGRYYVNEHGTVFDAGQVTYVDGGDPTGQGRLLYRDQNGNEFWMEEVQYLPDGTFATTDEGRRVIVSSVYDSNTNTIHDASSAGVEQNQIIDGNKGSELTYGKNPNWQNHENYRGTIYGGHGSYGTEGELDVFYDPQTNTYYTITDQGDKTPVSMTKLPPEVKEEIEKPETNKQNNSDNSSSLNGNEGLTGDSGSTPSTPSSSDYTPQEITNTAQSSGLTTAAVIAALNAGATPEQIIEEEFNKKASNEKVTDKGEVDPSDGTGTPTQPAMNDQIEALIERGMTYEQAVANQNAAIKAGADANNDGMVTNAEWSAHTTGDADSKDTVTNGSNSTTGKDVADNTVVADGGDNVTNGTSEDGTGDEVVAGDKTGSDAVDDGTGAVDDVTTTGPGVTGTDNGPGDGPVEGPGGNGPGGNGPGGNGMMGMAGSGGGVPFEKFSQLDPYVWQRFQKRRNPLINTAPTPTQNRRSLLSGLWNEAMK
jgi:hypothetical protein